jgi:hypothetical protein
VVVVEVDVDVLWKVVVVVVLNDDELVVLLLVVVDLSELEEEENEDDDDDPFGGPRDEILPSSTKADTRPEAMSTTTTATIAVRAHFATKIRLPGDRVLFAEIGLIG